MFYFFKKGTDTITCEVRASQTGSGYDIVISEPNGTVRTETYPTSEAVHKRWLEVLERFQHDGLVGTAHSRRAIVSAWLLYCER